MADKSNKSKVIIHGTNIWTGEEVAVEIDPITRGTHVIESDHHQAHEGYSFTAYYTATTAATDGHRSGLYLKTPPAEPDHVGGSNLVHAIISFASSAAANLSICESPTIAANVGTHTPLIINRYRGSSKISGCYNNATVPARGYYTTLTQAQIAADGTWATGTILRTEPLRVGDSPKPAGGSSRGSQEYILKANTAYVFLLTNTAASANTHFIEVDWYEHRNLRH
jgi:hypothetical protein